MADRFKFAEVRQEVIDRSLIDRLSWRKHGSMHTHSFSRRLGEILEQLTWVVACFSLLSA